MRQRLYRSRTDRVIAGVCGGLAEYFELDPAIVRIVFIVLFLFNGIGLLAYFICWIAIPQSPIMQSAPIDFEVADTHRSDTDISKRWMTAIGVLLVLIGASILLERIAKYFLPWIDIGDIIPFLLIVGGVLLVYRGWKERSSSVRPISNDTPHAT